jgi:tRNA(Ile)-lysidine synthase
MAAPVTSGEASAAFAALSRFPRLALAVSGGADSMALLHLVARWRSEGVAKPDVTVLTVDHRLRSESREEADMVGGAAKRLGLSHVRLAWQHDRRQHSGVQERARQARYDLMAGYCHANDIPALVTAHHLDDQAETFLMRLKRGSGLDGLAAIPEESSWSGILVVRPLLNIAKARLAATLIEAGLGWAEDPSNRDSRFERSRIRADHDAVAKLGLTPEALARSARRLRRARAALDRSAETFLAEHGGLSEAGYGLISRNALIAAPEEIALRALSRVLIAVGGRAKPLRLSALEALLASLIDTPKSTHTLAGCRLQPLGERIGIFRETRGGGLPTLRLAPGQRGLWDNRFRVELRRDAPQPVTVGALGESRWRDLRAVTPWLTALPRFAAATLPACHVGDAIVLPSLEPRSRADDEATVYFRARFIAMPSTRRI